MSGAPGRDELKRAVGRRAAELVRSGMVVGLGTGSTAKHFVDRLGERLAEGLAIRGIPTSERTAAQARSLGIPLATLVECPVVDVAVDGCDQVDPQGDLIKGLGGALTREKQVARAARELVIVCDPEKEVPRLGVGCPVPVEVLIPECDDVAEALAALGAEARLRRDGEAPYVTDNGNWILDAHFGAIDHPSALESRIDAIPGVVENGLFPGMAGRILVGDPSGVREWRPPRPPSRFREAREEKS
ncbi:MAG: ribose-5-phosphate isomerase RpiA [bacterium]